MNDWKEIEDLYFNKKWSMTELSKVFTDKNYRQIQKHLQRCPQYQQHYIDKCSKNSPNVQNAIDELERVVKKQVAQIDVLSNLDKKKNLDNQSHRIVGVISDTHFPFVAKGYLPFLIDTFAKYGVTEVVHAGDMCDGNAISRFQSDPSGMSATEEYKQSLALVKQYAKEFPKLKYCTGNHSLIPERQAATLGIPKIYMKDIKTLWEFPEGWEVGEQFIIDRVLYEHGLGWGGKTGALDKATNAMMSCVIGHSHAFGGCLYKSNSEQLIFGLNAGCGINIKQYAFSYSKHDKSRAVLGCGIVFNSSHAIFEPMSMKYFNMGD